jgi:hypothetical protein
MFVSQSSGSKTSVYGEAGNEAFVEAIPKYALLGGAQLVQKEVRLLSICFKANKAALWPTAPFYNSRDFRCYYRGTA